MFKTTILMYNFPIQLLLSDPHFRQPTRRGGCGVNVLEDYRFIIEKQTALFQAKKRLALQVQQKNRLERTKMVRV